MPEAVGDSMPENWNDLAGDLESAGDDAVDRLAAAALANPDPQAAPFLIRALRGAVSESSKRAAGIALAINATPGDSDAVEALEEAYRQARQNASLGPALLRCLGLQGIRCATARAAAISEVQRLKPTDTTFLLTAAAKVAGLLLGEQDDPGLRKKLADLLQVDDLGVQAEAHYQLALLALADAFGARTHDELLSELAKSQDGLDAAADLEEVRPDAVLVGLLVRLVLQFDAIESDRQAASSAVKELTNRIRGEVGGAGARVFQGYRSAAAVRFAARALDIAEALDSAAAEVASAARWTNFDLSVVRLAECFDLIRSSPEMFLGVGRLTEGMGKIADRVMKPRVGPVLRHKVGRESLAQVISNYRQLNGEAVILTGLLALQEAELEAERAPGTRLSDEKHGKLAALAAKVQLTPDELVDEMVVVVSEDQGAEWAVKVGVLPQSILSKVKGSGMPQTDVVLVTVNEHETQAVLEAFERVTGAKAITVPLDGRVYRNLGTVKGATVFHALSEMGSGSLGAMQSTVDKLIRALDPAAVIAVGIAFGVNEEKQDIGDILISKQLRPYELQRYGADIKLRGDKPHASTWLIDHFSGFAQASWEGAKIRSGVILSGEKLIDDIDYRNQLLEFESEAIGGEMEGAGLYVSCQEHKRDWIVIKAICDWADGNKARNKDARQKKAAVNAAEFLIQAMQYAPIKRES
jgi:nucleoside phosphorylase